MCPKASRRRRMALFELYRKTNARPSRAELSSILQKDAMNLLMDLYQTSLTVSKDGRIVRG